MATWAPGTDERSDEAKAVDERFRAAVADDLDLPRALVVLNETAGSAIPDAQKYGLLASWDAILGLDLERDAREGFEPTGEMLALVAERDAARAARDFATSDAIRERLQAMGLEVMDSAHGTKIRPRV
jgi:cysteinyl-tRNA synthetase